MDSSSDNGSSSDDEDYVPDIKEERSDETDADVKGKDVDPETEKVLKEEVDKIWKDFKADVGEKKKTSSLDTPTIKPACTIPNGIANIDKESKKLTGITPHSKYSNKQKKTITVTKVYDFAGESVKITKEVDKSSKEAQIHLQSTSGVVTSGFASKSKRRVGLRGILGKMEKRPKLSTLEKSKLDWQDYKQEEGIEDELKIHIKGKDGYVEKQLFLERTDHRQFEKERDQRLGKMSKR